MEQQSSTANLDHLEVGAIAGSAHGGQATTWPFAPLTDQQQRQQQATEAALRAGRVRVFRAFDDTVAGALA